MHPYADLLKAVAEGKELQARRPGGVWEDTVPNHLFMNLGYAIPDRPLAYEFRVKQETKTGWINFYPSGRVSDLYDTKAAADEASAARIACIEITYTPGEGL